RRRHTIFSRDWSSDVCSSDLQGLTGAFAQRFQNGQPLFAYYLPVFVGFNDAGLSLYEDGNGGTTLIPSAKQFVDADPLPDLLLRSEERRVGKRWSSRAWRAQL